MEATLKPAGELAPNLKANEGFVFESGKTYTHSLGLSCSFRQWRAFESHCRFLHGYALQVTITFRSGLLDDRNWVVDFGSLKPLKKWLEDTFDHKLVVARDDPEFNTLIALAEKGLADPTIVDHVGCEAFAKMIYDQAQSMIPVDIDCVEVREHESNFARYRRG